MALLARDSIADVRGMLESHVDFGIKPVHALPGRFLPFGSVGREFLDFRFIGGNGLMACHAEGDTGNSGVRSLGYARVAALALKAVLDMNVVLEGDRLHGGRL